jgi:hypothetical protein
MLSGAIETKEDDGIWFRRTIASDAVMQRKTSQSREVRVVRYEDEAHVRKPSPAGGGAGGFPDDGRPTHTPVPGHPLLHNGEMLVYPRTTRTSATGVRVLYDDYRRWR